MKQKLKHYFFNTVKLTLKSVIRAFFVLTALLVALIGAAWFTAVKYISAEHFGKEVAAVLQEALNRPVVIGSMKLTSFNSFEINNLRIVDTRLEKYNEFLSVEKVIVRFDLLALKENIVDIKELWLLNPVINIIKDEKGLSNIPDINVASRQSATGQQFDVVSEQGSPWKVLIEDWVIKNGVFAYIDIGADTSHSLSGIFVRFYNLKFNEFTDYSLNFVLRNKLKDKIIENEIVAKGSINLANFDLSSMGLKNTSLEILGAKKPLKFQAEANNFANPVISLSSNLPLITYEDVSLYVNKPFDFSIPASAVKTEVSFSDKFSKASIKSLSLKNKDISLSLKGEADFTQSPLSFWADFSTGEFQPEKVDYTGILKPYQVKGQIKAKGRIEYKKGKFSSPKFTVDLNGVSAFISNFTIEDVKGTYIAQNNFNDMNAEVKDGVFKVGRQTVSNIKGTASYQHKQQNFYAKIKDTLINGNNSTISVAISKVRQDNRVIKANLYLSLLSPLEVFDITEDFVEALSYGTEGEREKDTSDLGWLRNFRSGIPEFMPNFNGFVYAAKFETPIISGYDFNAEFDLKNLLPGMDKLNGQIEAKIQQGTIYKLQEAADRQKALGIAYQPFVIMSKMERAGSFKMNKVLKDTPFDTMTASVGFNNGKMNINNFYVDGNVLAAAVDGNVDWVNETLDLDIVTMFRNTSKRGALSENLTDETGEPALAFRTYGPMTKAAVQMKSPKKTNSTIKAAREKGLSTDFSAGQDFVKEK